MSQTRQNSNKHHNFHDMIVQLWLKNCFHNKPRSRKFHFSSQQHKLQTTKANENVRFITVNPGQILSICSYQNFN